MSVLLEVRGLGVRSTERTLLDGVNVTVFSGEVTALCGPSGSGKSVTARAAMGVVDVEPGLFSGSLKFPETGNRDWFAGVAQGGQRAHARLLADTAALRGGYLSYSPQAASSALNPGRTIGRQMEISVARRKTAPTSVTETIRGLLAEVGLPARAASALPGELSGGQCQRAALAVAMASDPRVLIADEPETGLDPVLRRQVVELLLSVGKAHGCGILLISHHEDTVDRIAEHVVRLRGPAEVAA
ncbi:MAG: ATP-binding cassette domain-containing protein [Deltaproteobacteria bacterium]|nr:ATP-binding cassette domain-containing protein [Deltaproteobacteria bacterium]